MTDNTPKKPRRDSGVNMEILAAWDHQPGDPERPGWRDLRTGADVRLMDVNQPSNYEGLKDEEKAAIQGWIARELVPSPLTGPKCTYVLKHIYQRLTGHYVQNGQFKGAMLAAGFEPIDRTELNWQFRYELADPQLPAKSIAADIERWRVA